MNKKIDSHRKWEVVYEDDFSISTWKYNSKISWVNPVEVSIKHKDEPKETKPTKKRNKKS
jgi:hypothetical protein